MRHSAAPKRLAPLCGLLLTAWLTGCKPNNSYHAPPPPPVTTSKPVLMPMTSYLYVTGSTAAVNSVQLVARVAGYLDRIDYTDGSVVKKGQLLFVIEPEPYAAKLQQAVAAIAQAKAQVLYAQAQYDRQLQMIKQNATSQANVEQWLATRDSDKAAVIENIANAEIARINYGYTSVSAPFDGRVSRHLVDVGNLVGNSSATVLATIDQLDPIYVYFNVNELDLLKLRAALVALGRNPDNVNGAPIFVGLQSEAGYPHPGKIDYVATSLNPSTGTLEVRAVLDNGNNLLLPGLFVHARVPLGKPVQKLALPEEAVLSDQAGPYVYVVGADDIVAQKRVQTGTAENGMIAVTGLAATDQVIIDGLQNAAPGVKVAPGEQDFSAPAAGVPG
ncbi:MAG TPA: efflux RND transporter periplasmic adaptor subunit [Acidocella sp.]|jgi:RND family efflux transporter MFP subunit|uniref:efflux RND transporter periplasmic adaptor subunit n=1 Tax=Acidocella sp. TaxID=50710 RepID=UPI002C42DFFF|nr:efflux RND transporter periplasmic adaptor subunit [Acidocella sp.]HVE23136.1 efflux RND transporter periplasmic adaptor subunit [Acidocella sp.]